MVIELNKTGEKTVATSVDGHDAQVADQVRILKNPDHLMCDFFLGLECRRFLAVISPVDPSDAENNPTAVTIALSMPSIT